MKLITLLTLALFTSIINAQDQQPVSFVTADGGKTFATYFQSGPKAVVLAHGAIFNKESWQGLIKNLLKNKISVLSIDFRGYGQSKAGKRPADKYEDILAGVHFLNKKPEISSVSVLGASMGGAAAARASIHSKKGDINRLILLSPAAFSDPENIKSNTFYIASKNETIINHVKDLFQKTPEPKKIQLLEGTAHAQHIFKTSKSEALTELIIHFIK
ncbi:MAG: alpha/beta hydrolase [Methylococcaceae bacterium]|nr:alpha/beta hydrolase [Methylococcaceae bacterium]